MDWVALVSAIAAVVSAGVAVWQALQARGSRQAAAAASVDARAQADRSLEQAKRANDEAARAVSAQQSIAEGVRRLTAKPEPWMASRLTGGGLWELRNASERRVVSTRIQVVDGTGNPAGDPQDGWVWTLEREWPRGSADAFRVWSSSAVATASGSDPGVIVLTVWWREIDADPDEPDREWRQVMA